MILAILKNISSAETLLNNLSEADFDLNEVSIIWSGSEKGNALGQDAGPLKGIKPKGVGEALIGLGVSQEGAKICQDAVINKNILLVMNVAEEYRPAAEETLRDHESQIVKG